MRTASVFASRRRSISFCTSLSIDWTFLVSAFSSDTEVGLLTDDDDSSVVVELRAGPVLLARIDSSDDVASMAAIRCCAVRSNWTCLVFCAFDTSSSVAANRDASGASPVLVKRGLPPVRTVAQSAPSKYEIICETL